MRLLLTAVLMMAACDDTTSQNDLSGTSDLSASVDFALAEPATLCTSAACASSPCDAHCVFVAEESGACPAANPSSVATRALKACPNFCGLQATFPLGCLRYRSEDPACPTWCTQWGTAACWESSPKIDYQKGGAICGAGFNCFGGFLPQDFGTQSCVDLGARDL
jgi:hypothetical protein